ncbi:RhuM family protein [Thiolinea disciformis]|uniref:RhuM family protein n=1 Tax=Thiolinea disciformis TaxID=125614 RepID=UPI00036CB44D|nr:RhuM family protein [Thiolinea disciformis]
MSDSLNQQALLTYQDGGSKNIEIIVSNESVWITQKNLAEIFGVNVPAISKHISNIFEEGELDENSVVSILEITASDGKKYKTAHYHLDAIISVGYRVNSQKATKFRIWATQVLRQYITDGFVIDEKRLRDDPEKLNKLAAKIRELRANEKNVYASVRECFKISASDYDPSSPEVKTFYALLQDKFHHAVTKMTASKLILERADHADQNMGVQSVEGFLPTLKEAQTGKNYLTESELYRLHLLSEQFLLYAESTALRGERMTMRQLHQQLDKLLILNGYPVFDGYKDFLKDSAMQHAEKEFELYLELEKLKLLGVEVDLQAFYDGEYDIYKDQTEKMTVKTMSKMIEIRKHSNSEKPKELPYNPWA